MGIKTLALLLLLTCQVNRSNCGAVSTIERREIWRDTVGETLKILLEIGGQELSFIGNHFVNVVKTGVKTLGIYLGDDDEILDHILSLVGDQLMKKLRLKERWDNLMDTINEKRADQVLNEERAEFLRRHLKKFETLNSVLKGIKIWRENISLVKYVTRVLMQKVSGIISLDVCSWDLRYKYAKKTQSFFCGNRLQLQ